MYRCFTSAVSNTVVGDHALIRLDSLGVNSLGVNSGGQLSRATDFGSGNPLSGTLGVNSLGVDSLGVNYLESQLWGSTVSGYRFWI